MSTTFSVLIFLLIIALIIFLIGTFFYSKILEIQHSNKDYLELKYQMQFYIAVFSVLIGLFSFLGYSSYKDIEANV